MSMQLSRPRPVGCQGQVQDHKIWPWGYITDNSYYYYYYVFIIIIIIIITVWLFRRERVQYKSRIRLRVVFIVRELCRQLRMSLHRRLRRRRHYMCW